MAAHGEMAIDQWDGLGFRPERYRRHGLRERPQGGRGDITGKRVAGATLIFASFRAVSGAGATLSALSGANGADGSFSVTAAANASTGSYTVVVNAPNVASTALFTLANTVAPPVIPDFELTAAAASLSVLYDISGADTHCNATRQFWTRLWLCQIRGNSRSAQAGANLQCLHCLNFHPLLRHSMRRRRIPNSGLAF